MEHAQATKRLLLILILVVLVGAGALYAFAYGVPGMMQRSSIATSTTSAPVATATSSPIASTTTTIPVKPTSPIVVDTSVTITNADSNSTIHLLKGQTFVLQLGNGLNWTPSFDPASSVTQLTASSSDNQGSYKVTVPGTITLKATGAPICKPNQACPMFLALFTTTLVVQ